MPNVSELPPREGGLGLRTVSKHLRVPVAGAEAVWGGTAEWC